MGSSTNYLNQPGPLDKLRAGAAGQLSPDLLYALVRGMRGMASPKEKMANLNMQQQYKHYMGRMGTPPGDLRMHEFTRQATEGLTYPNMDAMNAALQMYTGIAGTGGRSTGSHSPGATEVMGGLGNLGMAGGLGLKMLKGGM
jgi:hypothetical protein